MYVNWESFIDVEEFGTGPNPTGIMDYTVGIGMYIYLSSDMEIMLDWYMIYGVFNATFNNISVISRWSVLLVEETRVPAENQ
jgi:hypothetical protein